MSNERMQCQTTLIFTQAAFFKRMVIDVHDRTCSDGTFAGLATGDELCGVFMPEDVIVRWSPGLSARIIVLTVVSTYSNIHIAGVVIK